MSMTATTNTDILVSYSAKDAQWLSPLWASVGPTSNWDDTRSVHDETWFDEFSHAIEAARLIVCVLSPDYLASELVRTEEVPYLIERRARAGVPVVAVLVRPCEWRNFGWLRGALLSPRDGRPLDRPGASAETAMREPVETINALLHGEKPSAAVSSTRQRPPEKVNLGRLPSSRT
jgi:hypothetical protein